MAVNLGTVLIIQDKPISIHNFESFAMRPCFEKCEGEKKKPDKLTKLWTVINSLVSSEFTGYLKLNFTQGGIGKIEKFEEILKK